MNAINMYPDDILIVDDTSDNLRLLQDILSNAGYRVRLANDGELALRSARIQPPALVLLDIRMPGMDGYEVCRRLKADERTRSIPVIFLSILEDEREKVKAFHTGGVDYINKPIRATEVLARVHTHLALRHAQLELEARNAELSTARDTLEEKVRERSAELEQANQRLQQQIEVHLQTLETLRKSESKYRQLIDTASEGLWMLGPDLMTTYVNERMAEMIGYSAEQLIGRPFTDFMFEEDVPDHHARMEKRRQGISEGYERRIRHKDGTTVWAHLSATVIFDEKHRFQGTFAMFTDITERKRAEEALREINVLLEQSSKFTEALLSAIPTPVFYKDREGRYLGCNHAFTEILGFTSEQIKGKTVYELWPEEHFPIYHSKDLDLMRNPARQVYEFAVRDKFGVIRPVMYIKDVFRDVNNQVAGIIGAFLDITDRKQAEEALQESEKRYRIVADNTYDWEFWISPDGKFLYNSPSCERITGHTADEFVHDPTLLNRIVHPDDREACMRHREQVLTEKIEEEIEFRVLLPDGSTRYIGHVCQPVFDEHGQYLGKRGSNRDITERKRAEEEVRILNRELEQRVADRTSQLEAANRELEAFSYSVSHDLRAPLRHIDSFVELLQQRTSAVLDEQSRHYMTMILDEAKRMGVLIDELLSFSRMGRQGLSRSQVDLNKLVQEIVIELESEAKGRTINWHITGLPIVSADRTLIRAVLANVISNAIKFTRPCAVGEIEIGSQPGAEAGQVIYVRDNGVGFDMQYAGKLFGVFQRLHRDEEFEGTGIGLATVHRIITRHGGRVWAEGELGHGATFYFALPQFIKEG